MTATLAPVCFAALGTTATVVVDGGDDAVSASLAAVRAELVAIDGVCSRFRPDSELSRVNAAGGRPVPVSPLLREAVGVALRAARLTGGLVDPTLGRALRRLGYDRDFRSLRDDEPAMTRSPAGSVTSATTHPPPVMTLLARSSPGWRVINLDDERGTISVPDGMELDLGATAKALAADRAARAAQRAAGCAVLVSLGGDVAVAGPPPPGGWSIRVTDDQAASADAPGQTITIMSGGLATSGTTVRRWRHAGKEVHHLLDPATGRPVADTWRTVSVAARSCVDANTASTAAIILGRAACNWLLAQGMPARLVATDGTVTTVAGWP